MSPPTLISRADPPTPSQCLQVGDSPLEVRLNIAAKLFGTNAAWLLLGFVLAQTYSYYRRSAKDPLSLKMLAYGIVFIVTAERAVDSLVASYSLVSRGNPLVDSPVASVVASDLVPLFAAIPAIFVQFFFTWRIWTFCMAVCGRWMKVFVATICFFTICTSICALVSAITLCGIYLSSVPYPESSFNRLILIWTISTAVADVIITASMLTMLRHAKSSAYFGETRDRISHLLRLTLQTGFITSIFALPIAPLYLTEGFSGGIHSLTEFLLGESYVISLLANLNARSYHPNSLDRARDVDNVTTPHISSLRFVANQPQDLDGNGERSAGMGILSFIQSVAHTIHRDLTETTHERASRIEREAQLTNFEDEVAGNNQVRGNSTGEIPV